MTPQSTLEQFSREDPPGLSGLTDAEQDAWNAVKQDDRGVREYARETDRSPGTVGNLLARARRKVTEEA